jgi:type IV pilus assembly protein PilO
MSRRIRLWLGAIAILVVALLVFFLVINPIRGDISQLETDIEAEEARISTAMGEIAKAEDTKNEGRRNQARILELSKLIPVEQEIPSLILEIQDLADKAGIDWIQITPGNISDAGVGSYWTLPLSLQFTGTYFDVSDFIYRAEQMAAGPGRLMAVKSLGLTPQSVVGNETGLGVAMVLYAFLLPGGLEQVVPLAAATPVTETTVPAGTNP